jgi:DNA polymerase-3 subunit beta
MFEITSHKSAWLTPLLTVAGAVDKKQSLAVLSNILMKINESTLTLTATDLEIEITAIIPVVSTQNTGNTTIPAKKMLDIIRSLDDESELHIRYDDKTLWLKTAVGQFKLSCLPAEDFPAILRDPNDLEFTLPRTTLLTLLESTHFALSQQDIRAYLNGLLLEIQATGLTTVGMDGHRMAVARAPLTLNSELHRLVIPRKGAAEMIRLLQHIEDETIAFSAGKNHIRIHTAQYTLTSHLLETRFPAYAKVIPQYPDQQVTIAREPLKRALSRITILANEKSRVVRLQFQAETLTISANNQIQEEATESVPAQSTVQDFKIGVNAAYLLDVLNYLDTDTIRFSLGDMNSSILIEPVGRDHYQYVIMPVKI